MTFLVMSLRVFAGFLATCSLWLSGSVLAMDIPPLTDIAPDVAAVNPDLAKQHAKLASERKALRDRTLKHNAQCKSVEEGSPATAACEEALAKIMAEVNTHVTATKQFNSQNEVAAKLVAAQRSAPHTDTSVVDARNVPSGLPKGVENAVNGAYANAPPGVVERVRKGFQAVMARDWPVAKAWFQDALNRDPGNAHLKRLVALAGQAPQGNRPTAARRDSATPSPALKSLNASAGRMNSGEIMKALENMLVEKISE